LEDCKKYQLLIIFLLGLTLAPAGSSAGATDISGTWEFSVSMEDARGPQNALSRFVLKREGEKVSGAQGENKVTGTIESPTKMSGAVEFVKGPARWTATKK
jgi:hypothetical protein